MNSSLEEFARRPRPRRGGRRAGDSGTRGAVLDAARRQFAAMGYDRTTMRSVADEAGVDPKLVAYFFGSKHALFVAASRLPFDPVAAMPRVLGGDPRGIGERLARLIVGMLEDPEAGSQLIGLVRAAAAEPEAARMTRELFTSEIWAPVADRLPAACRPELVVGLVATQVLGLVMARYVIRSEPLASLPPDAVVAAIAPALQRLLGAAAAGDSPAM
jgi:AcrR family transcriptional regulator